MYVHAYIGMIIYTYLRKLLKESGLLLLNILQLDSDGPSWLNSGNRSYENVSLERRTDFDFGQTVESDLGV